MLTHMTTGRYDSREWPPYQGVFDVPEWEAEHLVRGGNAEYPDAPILDRGYDVLRTPDPDYESGLKLADGGPLEEGSLEAALRESGLMDLIEDSRAHPERMTAVDLDDFDNDFDRDDDDNEVEDVTPQVKRPSTVDNKDAWIEWAVHKGADRERAAAKTKKMLIADY